MISVDYLVGAILGVSVIMFFNSRNKTRIKKDDFVIRYSQSHIFEVVKPLIPDDINVKINKNTQSYKHEKKTNVKVIIMDGEAFWIKDNIFYTAICDSNGIDKESTSVVDIMGMDKVQLNRMLFIMDQLRDGETNDSGSAGD
jgi:hypothetical protein